MSGYRVQCAGCGFVTEVADEPCPRCATPLSLGQIIGDNDPGATPHPAEPTVDPFGWDQTEELGSLPKVTTTAPLFESSAGDVPELPSISAPELPAVAISGSWDTEQMSVDEPMQPFVIESYEPLDSDPPATVPPVVVSRGEETPSWTEDDWTQEPWTPDTPAAAQPWTPDAPAAAQPWTPPPPPPLQDMDRPAARHHTTFGAPASRTAAKKKTISPALLIAIGATCIAVVGLGALAAAVWSTGGRPSAAETRSKYAAVLARQPDFVASIEGFENNVPVKMRYASLKGERLVEVPLPKSMFLGTSASGTTQVAVIFRQDNNVSAVAHDLWVCRTVPKASLGLLAAAADPFGEVGRMAGQGTTTITDGGDEKVGEYDTHVILLSESGTEPIQVNIAPALNNLIVRLDVPAGASKLGIPIRWTLTNASMTVDPDLFRVPTSYNQLK